MAALGMGRKRRAPRLAGRSVIAATLSDCGQVRDSNEDSVYVEPPASREASSRGVLCALADGMGGYAAGEVASRMAVEGVRNRYYAGASTFIVDALKSAIEAANLDVWQTAQRQVETSGMGCTLTAAVILGEDLVIGHVGDSRAYLVHEDAIAQITRDHSWVGEQVETGALTRDEANRHPQRNVILRAIGARSTVDVDLIQEKVVAGDTVVLCSDGLCTVVSDEETGRIVVEAPPERAARALIDLANQRGAPDNVSVAILRIRGPKPSGRPVGAGGGLLWPPPLRWPRWQARWLLRSELRRTHLRLQRRWLHPDPVASPRLRRSGRSSSYSSPFTSSDR